MAVVDGAVDDAEEFVVEGAGDRAHGAVADRDAVDGGEVGDLGGGAGEEGFVADVEEFAGESSFDDGDAELAGERDDGAAGDAVQDRAGERSGVEDAAADEEEVFSGALGDGSR